MPAEYEYDSERNLITARFLDVVTDEELRDLAIAIADDTRITPGAREIVDLRKIGKVKVTATGLRHVAAMDKRNFERIGGQIIAVVAPTELLFGMVRMYQMISELNRSPSTVKAFREYDAAWEWLSAQGDKPL
jgi:hypothetical protein